MYKHHLLSIIAVLVLLFLFLPLFLIVLTSFNSADTISLPLEGFSLRWFARVFKSRSLVSSLKTSLILAVVASCIGLVIGVFAALAITRKPGKLSEFFLNLFLSPRPDPRHRHRLRAVPVHGGQAGHPAGRRPVDRPPVGGASLYRSFDHRRPEGV
jgi:putative spermidine/putrescine transport system permease protein